MLLHTWSLGVEQQFYLFQPPVLALVFRFKPGLKPVLAIGLPVLFLAGLWLSVHIPAAAFYLLPARAWELTLGVALAAGLVRQVRNPVLNGARAMAGLLAVTASAFLIDSSMVFPGWAALLPCLGTAAVIHAAGPDNLTGRLLSLPPLRFIALISYSLDLWHWPVLVTFRLYTAEQHLDMTTALIAVAVSVVLAALSWRYIENPFRSRSTVPFWRALAGVDGLAAMSLGVALLAITSQGLPDRIDAHTRHFISAAYDIDPLRDTCHGMPAVDDATCRFGDPDAEVDFVLVGDSHAAAIRPAVVQWAKGFGRAGTVFWVGGCPMLVGATRATHPDGGACAHFKDDALAALLDDETISTVLIAGRWEAATSGIAAEIGGSYRTRWIDAEHTEWSAEVTKTVVEKALPRTGRILEDAGKQVCFIGAVPDVGFDVSRILALASHNQGMRDRKVLTRNNAIAIELDAVFERVAGTSAGLRYVSIWQTFCAPECRMLWNGVPLHSDDDHIT